MSHEKTEQELEEEIGPDEPADEEFTCDLCGNTFFEDDGVEPNKVYTDPPERVSKIVGAEELHDLVKVLRVQTGEVLLPTNYEESQEITTGFEEEKTGVPKAPEWPSEVEEGIDTEPRSVTELVEEQGMRLDKAIHDQLKIELKNVKLYGREANDPSDSDMNPDSKFQFRVELPVNVEPDWIVCDFCNDNIEGDS